MQAILKPRHIRGIGPTLRLKPAGQPIERNQVVAFKARPHNCPLRAVDQHFRHQSAGMVGSGLHRALGAGRHHRQQSAIGRVRQIAVPGEEIAAFADRADDIGLDAAR